MPTTIKATWFYQDENYGWSESLWQSGAKTIQQVLDDAIAISPLRMALMGTGPWQTYIRVSDESILRDSLVSVTQLLTQALFNEAGEPITPINAKFIKPAILKDGPAWRPNADVSYSALLIRSESGSLYHRMSYMRGIPDDIVVDRKGPLIPKNWNDAFKSWAKQLNVDSWSFKVISKDPAEAVTGIVRGLTPQALPALCIINAPGHGLAPLQQVRFNGGKGTFLPKGLYTINGVPDADNFTVFGYSPVPGSLIYNGGLRYTRKVSVYTVINNVLLRGETHRATGRPFGSPVGRRPAKV